uniref:B3 domain-containing protein Os03g0212300 n=1 Tax=Anthurium amnicola TaxID=1678845 RepID=A0A1D1Z9I4_9ARAE
MVSYIWYPSSISIPRPFNKYIIRDTCSMATVLSPLGSWQVKVHGDDNYLYFREGWEEFCQAHNLYAGCFLVFSYEDEMVFRVTVFDSSTCMKEYTRLVEDNHVNDKTRGGSASFDKMKMTEFAESQKDLHEQHDIAMIESIDSQDPNIQGSFFKGSFKITVKPHSLVKAYLHIPRASEKINGISSVKKVMLRDPKMRLWPTSVYHHRCGKNVHSRFGFGWAKFCANNVVEEGDVCLFETLPEEKNFIIHVSILKKHTLKGACNSNSCLGEQCLVAKRSSDEDTTGERLEDDQLLAS